MEDGSNHNQDKLEEQYSRSKKGNSSVEMSGSKQSAVTRGDQILPTSNVFAVLDETLENKEIKSILRSCRTYQYIVEQQ